MSDYRFIASTKIHIVYIITLLLQTEYLMYLIRSTLNTVQKYLDPRILLRIKDHSYYGMLFVKFVF